MSRDVDPADLQRDLDRIKDAMGIAERYENAPEQWLWFGGLVAVACGLSQFVVLERLSGYWFFVIWFGLFGTFSVAISRRFDYSWTPGDGRPNFGFQLVAVYAGAFLVQAVTAPFLPDLGYVAQTAYVLGLVLVMLGVAYVIIGETLKAYHIRARDRYTFQVGGVLMGALGVAIPNVEAVHEWGFVAFGGLYLGYSVCSYWVLTRG